MFLWYFTFAILLCCNLTVAEQIESENAKVIGCNDETGLKQGANYFDFFFQQRFSFSKMYVMHPLQARNAYTNCKRILWNTFP